MCPKIILFEHPNCQGRCLEVTEPISHLSQYWFNNKVSSCKVISGEWKLFEHPDFNGRCYILDERGGPCCNGAYPFPCTWCGEDNEISSLFPTCR